MKPLRCLIVDDEELVCKSLQRMLGGLTGVDVVGTERSVSLAVSAVKALQPDVLFLDVQMPDGGGFEVLRRLESPPAVIFVTAYDKYAVRAFEVNAVDYLLKPVLPERLEEALARVRGTPRSVKNPSRDNFELPSGNDVVLLEIGSSGHFRKVSEVLCLRSDGKYTEVLCKDGQAYVVRRSISQWQKILPEDVFVRLDRSLLVNRLEIQGVDFVGRHATVTVGQIRHALVIGRRAAARLRPLLSACPILCE